VITVDKHASVAVVRLEHGKVNALDLGLLQAVIETFANLGDADAVVLTGTGRAFSAGVDLNQIVDGGAEYVGRFLPALSAACLAVYDFPRPVVAAVNGHAIAGGCVIACACDVRLMSGGTIGLTELLVGVPFPTVPLEVSRSVLGPRTSSMVFSGRTLRADEALAIGLIDAVVEPEALLDEACARAETLARIPADVYALTKTQLHRPVRERITALQERDDPAVLARWQAAETHAGMRDYLTSLNTR
jgi:enoyl-CoA hydratase